MKLIKLLIVLAAVVLLYQYWNKHHQRNDVGNGVGVSAVESRNGFVALPPVIGASTSSVLVIAAENCPEEAAQRADRLAEQLGRERIPVSRLHRTEFDIPGGDAVVAQRLLSIMNGELPIVFVNGRAKSNPTLEEVIDEYKGGV